MEEKNDWQQAPENPYDEANTPSGLNLGQHREDGASEWKDAGENPFDEANTPSGISIGGHRGMEAESGSESESESEEMKEPN